MIFLSIYAQFLCDVDCITGEGRVYDELQYVD